MSSKRWRLRTVRCRNPECRLLFSHEEVRDGLFYEGINLCARCWVYDLLDKEKIIVGACFGVSYQGGSEICRGCKLNPACRIELIDKALENPDIGIQDRKTRPSYVDYLVRVLRMIGRPMHVLDLVPLVIHLSGRKYKMTRNWRDVVRGRLNESEQAISLGDGFYVWIGYHNPGKEPRYAIRSIPTPSKKT